MGIFSQLFEPLERLINEHGSATILREQLALVKAKALDQETRNADLEAENKQMKAELLQHKDRIRELERQLHALTQGHHSGYCCDACGSPRVKRTGSRLDPTFGVLGDKQGLFTCEDCGHVSAFLMDRP